MLQARRISLFIFPFISILGGLHGTDLSDVTGTVFPGSSSTGIIAAYGDYNADKLIDIFLMSSDRKTLDILEARENKAHELKHLIKALPNDTDCITAVIPADFNGDALMDVLLTTQPAGQPTANLAILIYWGTDVGQIQRLDDIPTRIPGEVRDQPTLFDYNQDMMPDLVVETTPGQRFVWLSSTNKNFSKTPFPDSAENVSPFLLPHSNAFVDLNGDYLADLFLTTEQGYEMWTFQGDKLEYNDTVPLPVKMDATKIIGQAAFADIDRDGFSNLVVPICTKKDGDCSSGQILVHSYTEGKNVSVKQWNVIFDNFNFGGHDWNFLSPNAAAPVLPPLPITLRMGDYNMDGYPDIIVFLQAKDDKNLKKPYRKAVLLTNVACTTEATPCFRGRTFQPDLTSELWRYSGAVLGSFFDIYEDGILDILIVAMTDELKGDKSPVIRAYKQTSTTDTCFMKVTVTSGLCYKNCDYGREPYGVNVPGLSVKYDTISVNGNEQKSSGTQLSQSTHFSLQLPYVFFGLGLTPNFVDKVGVGIPVTNSKGEVLERVWSQIIPNSQLVVIPYPYRDPARWTVKLFVTPSQSVLITGAVLLGTCGFVAGIIGILHWRERREDQKEKRQESHKFHFDAM